MKKTVYMLFVYCFCVSVCFNVQPWTAFADQNSCKGNACVDFGETFDGTPPLQKVIKGKVKERREKEKKEKKIHPKCAAALSALEDPNLPPQDAENAEEDVQKFCKKSPGLKKGTPVTDDININGKKRGKKIKTTTTIKYKNAGQRYGHEKREKWDNVIIKPPKTGDLTPRVYREVSNTKDKLRKKLFLADETHSINNDNDCVDTITGEHKGGTSVPNGTPESCFETNGALKQTLTATLGGCVHNNGIFLEATFPPVDENGDGLPDENNCYNADGTLKTSLIELIDEDGHSPDKENPGDSIYDIDGDGFDGEDPSNPGSFPMNDDRDCVDMVTNQHKGGFDSNRILVADGSAESCFEANRQLKKTLKVAFYGCLDTGDNFYDGDPYDGIEDDCYDDNGNPKPGMDPVPNGCVHIESGIFFEGNPDTYTGCKNQSGTYFPGDPNDGIEDDCYYANGAPKQGRTPEYTDDECYYAGTLKITLAELIDEDNGQPINDDYDGETDEDGTDVSDDFRTACENIGKSAGLSHTSDMITPDGGCDLTRVAIVKANEKAKEKAGQKAYKADDQGYYDPNVQGWSDPKIAPPTEYGSEERQVVIEETVTVMCEEDMVLDDETGQCVPEDEVEGLQAYRSAIRAQTVTKVTLTQQDYAMMGFTFAPPRVRWGLFYKEELDLWFVTITLFEVKIGYDFSIGVGFRLPVEVNVLNIPQTSILAEEQFTPLTELQPENFTAQQYRDFCTGQSMGNADFCNRFAFPNALDPVDGDELAIRLTAFAGLKVVVVEIPLVNWGIDIDADLPEWCSLYLAWNEEPDTLAGEIAKQIALGEPYPFGKALSSLGLNCGTYTTPFGMDHADVPRQFPFIQNAPFVNQMIRADCAEAFVRGETIKLPDGETYPLCTGLILGVPGASLGLGLGVDLEISSNRIEADVSVKGDATFDPTDPFNPSKNTVPIAYTQSADEGGPPVLIPPVKVDNYNPSDYADNAIVSLGDFTYCLNTFSIRLKGQVMFGGILTIFPDFDDFTIYRFTIPGIGCGIPIGQHAGTKNIDVPIFVKNYGLEVKVEPTTNDPDLKVNDHTLKIKPGEFGEFTIAVKNIGSVSGDFDNFTYALSNLKDQSDPYTFVINQNTDLDCKDASGTILRDSQCFDAGGLLLPGLIELINEDNFGPVGALKDVRDEDNDGFSDEDPPDVWPTDPSQDVFNGQAIFQVSPYTYSFPPPAESGESLILQISPFKHPLTRPGKYPFKVTADSKDSKNVKPGGLAEIDPSGHRRAGAFDVAFIEVVSFRDPQIAVMPLNPSLKPGIIQLYTVEGSNMGNVDDSMSVGVQFKDFNESGCTLTTMGKEAGCPYRAVPTLIPGSNWTTVNELANQFGPLEPSGTATDNFAITVPRDWAGMQDTIYEFGITVTSLGDDEDPPASNTGLVKHAVIATKESMTRYIRLEIIELIGEIERANELGIKTGGLLPLSLGPAQKKIDQALELILSDKMNNASNALSSNVKIMEAFIHALDGFNGAGDKIPADLDIDWHNRAIAIIGDLEIAAASDVTSAPL